jgi:hypothetical protein
VSLSRCSHSSPDPATAAVAGSMTATSNPPAPAARARGAVLLAGLVHRSFIATPWSRPTGAVATAGELLGSGHGEDDPADIGRTGKSLPHGRLRCGGASSVESVCVSTNRPWTSGFAQRPRGRAEVASVTVSVAAVTSRFVTAGRCRRNPVPPVAIAVATHDDATARSRLESPWRSPGPGRAGRGRHPDRRGARRRGRRRSPRAGTRGAGRRPVHARGDVGLPRCRAAAHLPGDDDGDDLTPCWFCSGLVRQFGISRG